MFLTKLQTQELTGYKIPSAQIRWLKENGFMFKIGADGYPRVLMAEIESQMLTDRKSNRHFSVKEKPNFEALYGKKTKDKKRVTPESLS